MGCAPSVINQVTTDLQNPPEYKKTTCKSVDIKLQQKIHPDLKPYTTSRPAAEVFEAAKAVCSELFSSVVDVDDARMEVECVDVTKLMRYKDDVIVRVSKGADGTRVDVRSASRVGKGDLGKNAQRVGEFYAALRAKLEQ